MSCYEGFRLNDAASECSMRSKARIDSLFEDSRSICSSMYGDYYGNVYDYSMNHENPGANDQNKANSAVQARIEAMFASIEAESGNKGECTAAILPVNYLGAAAVGGRVASVRGLQEPLRQLLEQSENVIAAELEVSRRGLTFRTNNLMEKTNPFRRIAVWSALKLYSKPVKSELNDDETYHHAFIPLVGDDQAHGNDDKHANLYRTMKGLSKDVSCYSPIFAVVMRRPGASKVLECHAFACRSEEDAVAAAATLYKALLADLESNRRRPRQDNGLGCISLASVVSSAVDYGSVINGDQISCKIPAPPPVRPPRIKKNSISGSTTDYSTKSNDNKPVRRKKLSEINANDVAEARKKRNQLLVNDKSVLKKLSDDCTSRLSIRKNDEDINNTRNKINSDNSIVVCNSSSSSISSNNKNNENGEIVSRKLNNYEKSMKKKEKFYDRNYCFVNKNGSIVGEVINTSEQSQLLYEKNHNNNSLYELNNSGDNNNSNNRNNNNDMTRKNYNSTFLSSHSSSPIKSDNHSYYKNNNDDEDDEKTHSCENSIYEVTPINKSIKNETKRNNINKKKLYEQHFKDADKIYTLEQNQNTIYQMNNNNSTKCIEHINVPKVKVNNRVSRIDEYTNNHRLKMDLINKETLSNYCVHKLEKKRNRAGSEPPLSKTETIEKILPDNKLKRSQSDLEMERGDLLTRVELPRRSSFLKSTNLRLPNNTNSGTPLGFTELFDEFRNQEGLTSVDDILDVIIDPEGMSFNELKPLYKEFLLKLASTLTQDELYQRSANIMKRRRRPQRRRSLGKSCLLGRAIKRSVSKLKSGPTEFTSVVFPAKKFNESLDSSSSGETRNRNRVLASRISRRKSWKKAKAFSASEDSDTCKRLSRNGGNGGGGANRSSSGYVSCSECSFNSESCTCVSADKCYCSLPRRSLTKKPSTNVNNPMVCGCDTDSCSESNKCYCVRQPTILEQLKQRGIVPSEGTLSRSNSPDKSKSIKTTRSHSTSRSLEYHKIRPSPIKNSSNKLALDYDLFNPGKMSHHSSKGKKVLVVSARDNHGRLVYVGGAERNKKIFSNDPNKNGAHHEALSIKKSAEIAAVFGPESLRSCRRTNSFSSMKSSISLEAGLGYLP